MSTLTFVETSLIVLTKLMRDLLGTMSSMPGLNIITGPINSEKKLIMKWMEELVASHVPLLHINLRSVSFNSVDTLVSTLHDKTNGCIGKFTEAAERFKLNAEASGVNFTAYIKEKNAPPVARLNDLLVSINGKLPPHMFWHGNKASIFIIDEANELSLNASKRKPDGHDTLHNLFKWLVMNAKELNCFHVILSSSDGFFHLWVANYVGTYRYKTYVIGDLPKLRQAHFGNSGWKATGGNKLCCINALFQFLNLKKCIGFVDETCS